MVGKKEEKKEQLILDFIVAVTLVFWVFFICSGKRDGRLEGASQLVVDALQSMKMLLLQFIVITITNETNHKRN